MTQPEDKIRKDLMLVGKLVDATLSEVMTLEDCRGAIAEYLSFNLMLSLKKQYQLDNIADAKGNLVDAMEFMNKLKAETLNKLSDMGWS